MATQATCAICIYKPKNRERLIMRKCTHCGIIVPNDTDRFCPDCGGKLALSQPAEETTIKSNKGDKDEAASLVGDKNVISDSTIIGRQDKYEASNITIHNNITEDHSHTTVVCAVSGKRIYMDQSIECPKCGKPVAAEYYVEASKRCENCEAEALTQFRDFAAQTIAGKTFDAALKAVIDQKAQQLLISESKKNETLRLLQNSTKSRQTTLSAVQQAELDAAIKRFIEADSKQQASDAYRTIKELHDVSQNYEVDFWYYLASAATEPEAYIKACDEELTDIYWQRYWAFLAHCKTGSAKGGAAIDQLHKLFEDHEDDIRLAEATYLLARGFSSFDSSMTKRAGEMISGINPDYLSNPLMMVYDTLKRLSKEGLCVDKNCYSEQEAFVIVVIFCGSNLINKMIKEQEEREEQMRREAAEKAEAERKAREEQERRQREQAEAERRAEQQRMERERMEREAAERERIAQQKALAADREKRMAEEISRLGGNKPQKPAKQEPDKAFAGYQNAIPEKKSKAGKIVLYILLAIIIIIAILFMIPAPESMQ